MRTRLLMFMIVTVASTASAQSPAPVQIRSATEPLPAEFRESATVLGYETGKPGLVQLKAGNGAFICLADDPSDDRFHVACYHKALEPFMLRGRELRAQKVANVDSVRYAEIDAKKLVMPGHPSALYSLTGKAEHVAAEIPAFERLARPAVDRGSRPLAEKAAPDRHRSGAARRMRRDEARPRR